MAEIKQVAPPETTFQPYVPARETRPEFTPRAVLLGVETTPWRWFHTWRVTQTSRAPQVATIVLTTPVKVSRSPARNSIEASR